MDVLIVDDWRIKLFIIQMLSFQFCEFWYVDFCQEDVSSLCCFVVCLYGCVFVLIVYVISCFFLFFCG